jgi:acetyl esterase
MPLDPQAKAVLAQIPVLTDEVVLSLAPPLLRQAMAAMPGSTGPVEAVARVENRTLPGPSGEIPVRIYAPSEQRGLPALVYFHGGGFVIGGLDTHDGTCRSLANAIGCAVVSVDYRLAPEHKFPAAPEDCYAAARWVAEKGGAELGIDGSRLAIGGDSAGGNLTAVVALMARDRGGPSLRHQLLIYPVANHDFTTASYEENQQGYLLSREMMRWFWNHYLVTAEDGANPYASPLRAASLAGLPPAHVITAEFDPLRDEGEALAARLVRDGVPTTQTRYDGMFHGFFSMGALLDTAKRAIAEAAAEVRARL